MVQLGEDFMEGPAFAAGIDGPGINEGKQESILLASKLSGLFHIRAHQFLFLLAT